MKTKSKINCSSCVIAKVIFNRILCYFVGEGERGGEREGERGGERVIFVS